MIATCLLDSSIIDALNGKRGRRPGEEAKTERLLRSLKFYPVTWEIAKQAGHLLNLWRQQNRTLSLPDTTIAAVALANDLMLVTGNRKDFPMPELRLHPLP